MGYSLKNILTTIILSAMLSCGQDAPISEYEPRSHEEAELKKVFVNFQNAVNTKDSKKISDLLHKNASLLVGRERKVYSREDYVKILPKRLSANIPIAFGKPKMTVSGNKAEVKVYMVRGSLRLLITYHMILDQNKWYINKWDF